MNARYERLVRAAIRARENAYSPYSRFKVGAAVLTRKGNIYTGANVENVSYGLTMCAERVAVGCAVARGERDIAAVAVVFAGRPGVPCGACLQVLREFGDDVTVLMADTRGKYTARSISEILPAAFCIKEQRRK